MQLKNSNFKKNLKIKKINTKFEFEESLNFLNKNFFKNKNLINLFKNYLIKNNKNIDYGFILINKYQKICGIILTFEQGNCFFGEKKNYVVNLSSWYVLPAYRGLTAIWFHEEVVKKLNKYIMTSYSANKIAEKVLRKLKFKSMAIQPKSNKFISNLNFKNLIEYKISQIKSKEFKDIEKIKTNYKLDDNLKYFNISCRKNKSIYLIGKFHMIWKNFFRFKIPILTFHILWTSDLVDIEKYISKMGLIFFLKWGIIRTIYYPKVNLNDTNNIYSKCFIKSDSEIKYLQPLGSEISLGI